MHSCRRPRADNLYSIRVKILTPSGAYYRCYSIQTFTGRTWTPARTTLSPDPSYWIPAAGSGIVTIPANVAVSSITLQAAVSNSANTLVIERCNVIAVIGRA